MTAEVTLDLSLFHRGDRFFRQWLNFNEPLIGKIRFNDGLAAVAVTDRCFIVFDLDQ